MLLGYSVIKIPRGLLEGNMKTWVAFPAWLLMISSWISLFLFQLCKMGVMLQGLSRRTVVKIQRDRPLKRLP